MFNMTSNAMTNVNTGLPGIVSSIEPSDPDVCKFQMYVSKFRSVLLVNGIKEAMHVALFCTVIGDALYQLLKNLLASGDLSTKGA